MVKFVYSEKATKFGKIFTLLLTVCTVCTVVKSKGKILQNFVAFSEYMNFKHFDGARDMFWIKSLGGTFKALHAWVKKWQFFRMR